jgi:hypothetical protein
LTPEAIIAVCILFGLIFFLVIMHYLTAGGPTRVGRRLVGGQQGSRWRAIPTGPSYGHDSSYGYENGCVQLVPPYSRDGFYLARR